MLSALNSFWIRMKPPIEANNDLTIVTKEFNLS